MVTDSKVLNVTHTTKVYLAIEEAGREGITHAELLLATRIKTSAVREVIKDLVAAFRIVARQQSRAEFGLGRQPMRYWTKENAPTDVLTETKPKDIPVRTWDVDEHPPRGGTCRQCGGAIPAPSRGPVPAFCSVACRKLWREGGLTLGRFLDRAQDPATFAKACVLFVAFDLTLRGYHVARDIHFGASQLIVHNGTNAVFLTVVPVSQVGYFPNPEDYECMAAVYRDGRIVYGGKVDLDLSDPDPEPEPVLEVKPPTRAGGVDFVRADVDDDNEADAAVDEQGDAEDSHWCNNEEPEREDGDT